MIFTDNKIMRLFVLLIIIYYFISQTTWDQPQIKIKHVLFILHIQKWSHDLNIVNMKSHFSFSF